jgi:hypothetical protein
MALSLDRRTLTKRPGFSNFGSLDSDQVARLNAVVAQAHNSATEAAALVPNIFTRGWDTLIGASSSVDALRSNAAAAQTLYQTLAAKRDRLIADPNSSEADVQDMEGVAPAALQNTASAAGADQLSLSAAYDQVVAQSASDLAAAVKNPFGIPLWVWGVGAVGILALLYLPKGRR